MVTLDVYDTFFNTEKLNNFVDEINTGKQSINFTLEVDENKDIFIFIIHNTGEACETTVYIYKEHKQIDI